MDRLIRIQSELKAPKNLKNNFGNYKYRNLESILEALKPLLAKEKLALIISDEIENIGGANYLKATAVVKDSEKVLASNSAYAREPLDSKGMSPSQMTGSASSYARKYALGGLFLIDDSLDVDSDEFHQNHNMPLNAQKPPLNAQKPPLNAQKPPLNAKNNAGATNTLTPAQSLFNALIKRGCEKEKITAFMKSNGYASTDDKKMLDLLNYIDDLADAIKGADL